jgi:hypothetical protein
MIPFANEFFSIRANQMAWRQPTTSKAIRSFSHFFSRKMPQSHPILKRFRSDSVLIENDFSLDKMLNQTLFKTHRDMDVATEI